MAYVPGWLPEVIGLCMLAVIIYQHRYTFSHSPAPVPGSMKPSPAPWGPNPVLDPQATTPLRPYATDGVAVRIRLAKRIQKNLGQLVRDLLKAGGTGSSIDTIPLETAWRKEAHYGIAVQSEEGHLAAATANALRVQGFQDVRTVVQPLVQRPDSTYRAETKIGRPMSERP